MTQRGIGRRFVVGFTIAFGALLGAHGTVDAHDEIESSEPAHRSQFDEPISEVTINFGEPVGGIELGLVDPDNNDVADTTTVRLDQQSARLTFAPLEQQGEYIVRFLAEEDGHLINGAISFTYGSASGAGASSTTWVVFGVVAVLLLAGGGFWSWRLSQRSPEDAELETA